MRAYGFANTLGRRQRMLDLSFIVRKMHVPGVNS